VKKKGVKKPGRRKKIFLFSLLGLGIVLMPIGFVLANVIQGLINDGINDYAVFPSSETSGNYQTWVSNDYEGAPEIIRKYYLWNLTNKEGYLQGEKPAFEEIGPFIYREYKTRYNIHFEKNGEEVTYNEYSTFVNIGELDPYVVEITNINPGFLGAIKLAGGSEDKLIEFTTPMVLSIVKDIFEEEINANFEEMFSLDGIAKTLGDSLKPTIVDIFGYQGNETELDMLSSAISQIVLSVVPPKLVIDIISDAMPDPEEIFYSKWANDHFPEVDADLYNLLVYLRDLVENETAYNDALDLIVEQIDNDEFLVEQMEIYNMTMDDYIDLLNIVMEMLNGTDDISLYVAAQDFMNPIFSEMIQTSGGILVNERGSATGEGVDIDGREPYNYPGSYTDLNISKVSFYTDNNGLLCDGGGSGLTYLQCIDLWDQNNPYSLTGMDYEINQIWFDAAVRDDLPSKNFLMKEFEINETQLELILDWLAFSLTDWLPNVIEWTLEDWNSGLIVTRTANEWLFAANDTSIYEHSLYYDKNYDQSSIGMFDSCLNSEEAEQAGVPTYTVKTGKNDISEVAQIIKLNGESQINIWAEPIDIYGTDGMQFHPGVTPSETLKVFNIDLLRTVNLEYDSESEVKGISLHRFRMAPDTFEPNPLYFQDTWGFTNLEVFEKYQGVAVRVSKPHLLDTEPSIQEAIIGMNPDPDMHETFIDVEPISGITMNAHMCVQVNFEVPHGSIWHAEVQDTYMPILWMAMEGEIPDGLADYFKGLVYMALGLKEIVPTAALAMGAVVCVPTAFLLGRVNNKQQKTSIKTLKTEINTLQNKLTGMKYKGGEDLK